MVDAVVMGECMTRASTLDEALAMYNADTVRRGKELHRSSRRAASYFAPAGVTPVSPRSFVEGPSVAGEL